MWDDNLTLTYLGSAPCPVGGIYRSSGLAYCTHDGNIYWSYATTPTTYSISEISFTIDVALEWETWTGIKAGF